MNTITLSAALIAGVAGSAHCVAMCGSLAGALAMRGRAVPRGWTDTLRDAGLYHVGRLSGYALAGAVFGSFGVALRSVLDFPMLILAVRSAAALLLILVALRILLGWNTLAAIERLGARFWRSIQPLVRQAASTRPHTRSLLLGLLWGWLPCGLVYSMLLFAALSGDALTGAAIMLAFGIGTLPAMLASSLFASRLAGVLRQHATRQLVGALLLAFGVWLGWAAIPSTRHVDHDHAAMLYLDAD
jgi:uncharacterized protein